MQEAILRASDYWTVREEADIAIYVADLKTHELLFLNKYARDRWGPEFRANRCREFLEDSDTLSCPFCNILNLVDANGRPKGVYRWEYHDAGTEEWFDCSDEVVEWSDGRLVHMEVAVNITERKRAEQTLQQSELFNRSIIQNSRDCIKIVDLEGRLQFMSEAGQKSLELHDVDAYIGRKYETFWKGKEREECVAVLRKALDGEDGRFTGCIPSTSGVPKWWDVIVNPVFDDQGEVSKLLVVSRDITKRKQTEDELERSRSLLKDAQAYAHVGYWALEADLHNITWSEETYAITGRHPETPVSFQTLEQIVHPDDYGKVLDSFSRALSEGQEHDVEYRIIRPDGQVRWVDCRGAPLIDAQGKVIRLTGFVQDITERKHTEQTLTRALKDKEVLLREIHHRVKNNLQVVASLLYLQAMNAAEETTVEALKESGRRIQLMAQVHEKLYRSSSLAAVRVSSFLRSLVEDMIATYETDQDRIRLTTELEDISLHIDQAIPCSQIVSELVSNSLKHAFPDKSQGQIIIRMRLEHGKVILDVEDDGIGMEQTVDWQQSKTIGLQVVNALAKQLGGEIKAAVGEGARYRLSFPRTEG